MRGNGHEQPDPRRADDGDRPRHRPCDRLRELKATPRTVASGNYGAANPPVLTIRSGDTVVIHALLINRPARLEKDGVDPAQVETELHAVHDGMPASARIRRALPDRPAAIEGAEPGDTLEVRIRKVDFAVYPTTSCSRQPAGSSRRSRSRTTSARPPPDAPRKAGCHKAAQQVLRWQRSVRRPSLDATRSRLSGNRTASCPSRRSVLHGVPSADEYPLPPPQCPWYRPACSGHE